MATRATYLANGEFYHVFNRGVAHIPIFKNFYDYKRFFRTIQYYKVEGPKPRFSFFNPRKHTLNQNKQIVRIICYCLMPNHFHFLLQQVRDGGITEFVSKLSNSYTKYFNVKHRRDGYLLQGEFKSVHVDTNEQLLHLSRYIHLNPLVGYLIKSLEDYPWSSYHEYVHDMQINLCTKDVVIEQFKSPAEYKSFVLDNEGYAKELKHIEHLLLE